MLFRSVPSGGPFRELSDISESKAPPRDSVASPSVAKATGASSGAPQQGPGTESGSAEKHENEMLHKKEDDSPSFNGNMGGGTLAGMGGSPGSPSPGTDSPQSAAEETMKDLLHEMKETAESGSPNGGLEGDGNSFPMSEEDLFPRVKACYLRSLKRGKVLNGIGEKISEETQ